MEQLFCFRGDFTRTTTIFFLFRKHFERCFWGSAKKNWTIRSVGGRTKEPILNETKSPILQTGQKRRFWKWDKTADFENETKPPISKMRQNRRFCKSEQIAIKIVSLIKASWPNYLHYAIVLPITIRKWDTTILMQFPSLVAANKFSRIPAPKILLKPSLPFNLNLWYPPPFFCVPKSSE